MKDWTSLLLQKKSDSLHRQPTDTTDVLNSFLPFLEAAAVSTDSTVPNVLASVLFIGLSKMLAAITDNELKKLSDDDAETTNKSGKLDALSDDCLGVVLSFVSAKNRCKSVEVSCHRLFHVSRRTPIFFQRITEAMICYGKLSAAFSRGKLRIRRGAAQPVLQKQLLKRVRVQHFDLETNALKNKHLDDLTAVARRSIDSVKTVTIDSFFAEKFSMHFRQLCKARLQQMSAEEAIAFLSLNASIHTLSLADIKSAVDAKCDLMAAVSKMKNVRSLKLNVFFPHFPISADCDFTHITDLALIGEIPENYYSKLLHSKLQCLELQKWDAIGEAMERRMTESLSSSCLKELKVSKCTTEFGKTASNIVCALPTALEAFECSCELREFAFLLSKSTAQRVSFRIRNYFSSIWSERQLDELANGLTVALQTANKKGTLLSLTVVINETEDGDESDEENFVLLSDGSRHLLEWLSQVKMPTFPIHLQMSDELWVDAEEWSWEVCHELKTVLSSHNDML